jgi:hypothetical protein
LQKFSDLFAEYDNLPPNIDRQVAERILVSKTRTLGLSSDERKLAKRAAAQVARLERTLDELQAVRHLRQRIKEPNHRPRAIWLMVDSVQTPDGDWPRTTDLLRPIREGIGNGSSHR